MTTAEFVQSCSAPLEAAYGSMPALTVRLYEKLLGDIKPSLLAAATAKCISESKWMPKISELRQAAVEISSGDVQEISGSEAWGHAQRAIRRIDLDIEGSLARAKANVPAMVYEAMQNVGIVMLINARSEFDRMQTQKWFLEAYGALVSRERKLRLAPPQVISEIESHRAAMALPASPAARELAGRIGG